MTKLKYFKVEAEVKRDPQTGHVTLTYDESTGEELHYKTKNLEISGQEVVIKAKEVSDENQRELSIAKRVLGDNEESSKTYITLGKIVG